jgi:hypothetical protein
MKKMTNNKIIDLVSAVAWLIGIAFIITETSAITAIGILLILFSGMLRHLHADHSDKNV